MNRRFGRDAEVRSMPFNNFLPPASLFAAPDSARRADGQAVAPFRNLHLSHSLIYRNASRPQSGINELRFSRITINPAICTGKPCIRGLRFPVARLLGLLASGETRDQILAAYPYLEPGDIDEALRYAAFLAEDETIELVPYA
jgi:uncharacterized protein (DUF433 family)